MCVYLWRWGGDNAIFVIDVAIYFSKGNIRNVLQRDTDINYYIDKIRRLDKKIKKRKSISLF